MFGNTDSYGNMITAGNCCFEATSGGYYGWPQDSNTLCSQPSCVSNRSTCFVLATETLPNNPKYLISKLNFENNSTLIYKWVFGGKVWAPRSIPTAFCINVPDSKLRGTRNYRETQEGTKHNKQVKNQYERYITGRYTTNLIGRNGSTFLGLRYSTVT
jgi:hypothetical protein